MNNFTKFIGAASLLVMSASASASNINVGGVIWDPEATAPEADFFSSMVFNQWYQTDDGTNDLSSLDASSRLSVDAADPATVVGKVIYGTGLIKEINGRDSSFFCPSCELTMAFGGVKITSFDAVTTEFSFDLSDAFSKVFVDTSKDFTNSLDPRPYDTEATNGDLWLDLKVETFGLASDGTNPLFGASNSFLSVIEGIAPGTGGLAADHFNTDTRTNGYDLLYTGSVQATNNAVISDSFRGTSEISADTIPEPATLAILGLGLVGLGAVRRKAK